jgi:dTDP-4-amino-4,6-dideoxygalactose transaminase
MNIRIPFNRAYLTGSEIGYVSDVLRNSSTAGDGVYSRKCESFIEELFSVKKALLTTSCTSALEMAVILCDLQPGDEVILPSFTFVSSANALVRQGARPRFVDIRPDTKNIDETLILSALTHKTKAIMPVHYAGVACDMDAINRIALEHNLRVIEDAAQGVNSSYKGAHLGSIGDLGAYSFHETKNYSCGEGGALLINDEKLIERAEVVREKGTDRSRFRRGEVDKYTWVDVGSSFLPSDILAAILYAQLEKLQSINEERRRIFDRYSARLLPLFTQGLLEPPVIPDACQTNYHMYYVLTGDTDERSQLQAHLLSKGILAVSHYVPLHSSPMGVSLGCNNDRLPVTEAVSERLLRLPMYCDLSDNEIDLISSEIEFFFANR